ncbi:M28 family metallopeptidase [Neobacillus drentensis]|uniref:M28 family metallopeptidase n=1 Tax=Neobacillus drentensis TaxID=220684 RepID=UPI0030004A26
MKTNLESFKGQLIQEVNQEILMEYTENVASEIRLSGTEEELRAFYYVKAKLEEFGLATELTLNDAYISLPGQAELKVNGQSIPAITHSMAVSTDETGLEGEIVYLGKSVFADFEKSPVSGKIALMDGLAIPGAVLSTQQAGAKAIIFINAEYTHEMIVSPVWGNPTPDSYKDLPVIPVVSVNFHDGQKIKEIVKNKAECRGWLKSKVDTKWMKIPTLTADIPVNSDQDHYVLFSGHIDSWHYGVMDNGTANATMLEVARILAKNKSNLRRSLKLAFWSGHSHGRYAGSALYCDEHWEDLHEKCVLHINIDSVGGKGATILTEANCMAETRDMAKRSIKELTGDDFEGSRFGRAGDQSFWGAGVPSLFMGLSEQPQSNNPASEAFSQLFGAGKAGGFGWWWHTTEDTLDKISPENLARDCQIYLSIVYEACSTEVLPVNQLAAVEELETFIKDYQRKTNGHLNFSVTVHRIEELKKILTEFGSLVESALSNKQITQVNKTFKDLSKILVTLNYVKGDRFQHDAALKQHPIPLLANCEKLADIEVGSHEYHLVLTELKRNLNKVNYSFLEAIRTVKYAVEQMKN